MYCFSSLEPVCCSMSSSNCCFLTCVQISQDAGKVIQYSQTTWENSQQFVVIYTVKGFGAIVNKAEVYAEYIMWNARLDEAQAGIKISRRNINNLRYTDGTTLVAEGKEALMSFLMRVKEEWKSWLKTQHSKNEVHSIQSHHFMVNRWGNSGNSDKLYFLGLQNHCRWWHSHEIKRCLLPGRKAMQT